MNDFALALWHEVLQVSLYLFIGLFLSSFLKVILDSKKIEELLIGNGLRPTVLAALFGIPLPLCSCSVLPSAITLRRKGVGVAPTSSFLISTPESGVDSISMTYAMMGSAMAILRPVTALISALFAGLLQFLFNSGHKLDSELEEKASACCSKSVSKQSSFYAKLKEGLYFSFFKLFDDISGWLAIGLIGGALLNTFLPDQFFASASIWQSKFIILLVGVPLYVCASGSTPLAAAMMAQGLSPGNALLFLLVGPATNLTNILTLRPYLGVRGIFLNLVAIIIPAVIFSVLVDFYAADLGVMANEHQHIHNDEGPFKQFFGVLFCLWMLRSLGRKLILKMKKVSDS